ncbi:MAG: amino acid permease [Alphaproteobacteria bacterium RIFCSPHIGHO2_12_FULL_63_12]|nr:MAG: amino acid permease [Alphaproteobacteria bacterium RIFCSPHIGHO2_12_FULL_63_12]
MSATKSLPKVLGLPDLVLFTVSAILLLDTLAASASIGASSLFWWLLLGVIFLIPIGLITAELATAYPEEGGLYVWIRRGLGRRWATRAVWAYWVNTAIWLPSIFILFAGVFVRLSGIELTLSQQIGVGIALAWLTALLDILGLKIGKWVPNLGALFKMIIFAVLILAGWNFGQTHGFANPLTADAFRPEWKEGLKYLPAIVYGMLGFELVSAASGEIKHPARDMPLSIIISGIIVLAFYFLATAGILAAIPASEINIVEGLIDTLALFFAETPGGDVIVLILGAMALFTFFSNGATWAMGCNRATAEAAAEGELPSVFAIRHKRHGGPIGAAVLMGLVCTTVLILYGRVATSNGDLFWSLFAFSAALIMLPYIGLAISFARLRFTDPSAPRPFRAPGGVVVACILALMCILTLSFAIALFVYVPGEGLQAPTLIGVVSVLVIGEILIVLGLLESRLRGRGKKA